MRIRLARSFDIVIVQAMSERSANTLRMPSGTALVIGHPGHELRLHGWLALVRPVVCVLTDGSGSSGISRLESTTNVLTECQAPRGAIYGRLTDRELYDALLNSNFELFFEITRTLAAEFERWQCHSVVADAAEGYNPGHDVCRMLVDTAIAITPRRIMSRGLMLTGTAPVMMDKLVLTPDQLDAKLAAAHHYPELTAEVEEQLTRFGRESFAVEAFVDPTTIPLTEQPEYERFGAERVQAGHYREVISYEAHMRPLANALAEFAGGVRRCVA
ncbi:hypothetical protein BH11PLA2_BH11PLA2_12940 [soil metagenome]